MIENLSFDNILDDEGGFLADQEENESDKKDDLDQILEEKNKITEVEDLDSISDDDDDDSVSNKSESGSDEKKTKEKEDTASKNEPGDSPAIFSSIAEAFAEEGVFPDLDDSDVKNVKSAEDFAALMKKQMQSQLDATQKRISDALDAGMEPDDIRVFEGNLRYLNDINVEDLSKNSDEAELTRKKLIFQDYINKGIKKEKAIAMTERSIANGTDIEDAKDALESNIEYFTNLYNSKVEEAKESERLEKKKNEERIATLRTSILEDKDVFGTLQIDKATRKRIYDSITQPVHRDKDTGEVYTAIQKYEMEHPTDFLKFVGMCFTLTDGFSKIDNLTKNIVKKETNKKMKELEEKLSNTIRTSDGRLDFMSGIHDEESRSSISLDI